MKRHLNNATSATDSDSEDSDYGPAPASLEDTSLPESEACKRPARAGALRTLPFESLYLERLPNASQYEKSYMHRDVVTRVCVTPITGFIVTASQEGGVKFWKKMSESIEFIKYFQAHIGSINALVCTPDGQKILTTSSDR